MLARTCKVTLAVTVAPLGSATVSRIVKSPSILDDHEVEALPTDVNVPPPLDHAKVSVSAVLGSCACAVNATTSPGATLADDTLTASMTGVALPKGIRGVTCCAVMRTVAVTSFQITTPVALLW